MSANDDIEILDRIDSGLYGSVYRAIQKPLGRTVAVKIIKTELKTADALAHAAPLARVNHPAIVTVHTVKEIYVPDLKCSVPAIVIEWVEGETLGKRLSLERFTADEVISLCRDVLDGVEHLHAKGLCHGDLHAGNIIVLPTGHSYFELLKIPYPDSRDGVLKQLAEEDAIRFSESHWNITYLGAILFAKKLDAFDLPLSCKAARFIVYDGVNKLKTKTDLSGTRGYAVGFEALVDYVHEAAPKNEYLEVAIREDFKMFPKQALRELIANAMVHQDFSIDGTALRIEMYDDRVEISNPCVPQIPTERFIDEERSRNQRLSDLMRRLGVCERKGSGVDKVVSSAELYQLPAPDFRVGAIRFTSVFYAYQDFADMTKSDRIRACFQHCVLQYISGKRMSNQSLRERFGLPGTAAGSATASQIIAAAKDANLIKADDDSTSSLRYARYVPRGGLV